MPYENIPSEKKKEEPKDAEEVIDNEIVEAIENKVNELNKEPEIPDLAEAPTNINEFTDAVYNMITKRLEELPDKLDTNKDGKVSKKEVWEGFCRFMIKVGTLLLTWGVIFGTLIAVFAVKELEELKTMIMTGEWSWDFIWGNIVSVAIASVGTYMDYRRKVNRAKTETAIEIAKNRADAAELREIAKDHAHEQQVITLKAEHEIRMMAKDLDLQEEKFQKVVKDSIGRISIEREDLLRKKIDSIEKVLSELQKKIE